MGLHVCSSDSVTWQSWFVTCLFFHSQDSKLLRQDSQCMLQSIVLWIFLSVQFGCQTCLFLTREFPWIVIYFYFILMSYILFSKTETLAHTHTMPPSPSLNNLKLVANSRWLEISIKTDPPPHPTPPKKKKQEQGAMPVNDCSEMTAESAGMQGKVSILPLQKVWVPSHPWCMAHKGQISLPCKAWVSPHPQPTVCKRSTVRVWVCTLTTYWGFYTTLLCVYSFMFIHPNTPVLVSTAINPSFTKS